MEDVKLKALLTKSSEIIKQHVKDTIEKGEDFNVFSILGMETNETKTHSRMLVALLDPNGNHYHGSKFLELFLQEIGCEYSKEDLKIVKPKVEHHLGKISKDYMSGGFIDILISFPKGETITIENKIHAGDQPKQMYRYSLFNKGKSKLYYLNLLGGNPSKDSLHELIDEDYDVITYNNQILKWLEKCLLVVKPGSIVENAIKQYQILIKNLTNTMDKHLENNLNELIIGNLKEAKYIHSHYEKAVDSIREGFRTAVCEKLNKMSEELSVKARLGNDVNQNYSQIWLSSELLTRKGVQFGLESFSGKGNTGGRMFIGLLDRKNDYDAISDGDMRLNSYWPIIRYIKTTLGNPLNLSSANTLEKLSANTDYFEEMVEAVVSQTKEFVKTYDEYYFSEQNN